MFNNLFTGIFDTAFTQVIAPEKFLLCIGVSLVLGVVLCLMSRWRNDSSSSFLTTLCLLPATVCAIIMMVNGNVGTGVAVAGTFSLVRFRSAAGSGREISGIFIAMAAGLMTGMGYLGYGALFTLVMGAAMMAGTAMQKHKPVHRQLRITIPESLDYAGVFDGVLSEYANRWELKQVKTTNMGSLFRLTYDLTMPDIRREKEMLDRLRCLNGNLEISLSYPEDREGL